MTKIDLENLPYPMFVTTDDEKEQLKKAWEILNRSCYIVYLCHALKKLIGYDDTSSLEAKITEALVDFSGETHTLFSYLCGKVDSFEDSVGNLSPEAIEIRKIWIKKLLAYSPETN